MDRRSFLKSTAGGLAGTAAANQIAVPPPGAGASGQQTLDDPRDGGIFGRWVKDEFGLPAFRYEMDHVHDPRATWDTHLWGKTNRHWHQLGNDRVTAIAANEGWVQIYSHEFGPRWINMYRPDRQSYAGGISFIQVVERAFSTMFRSLPKEAAVERIWGCSYSRFTVEHLGVRLERTVFAPFGDSPFLVARVRITNLSRTAQTVTHGEYWDLNLHNIDFSVSRPWFADQRERDTVSARLYGQYACAWDEKLGALIARHPWAAATGEQSLNWPSSSASNRPDVSLKPMGVKPARFVTRRSEFLDYVGKNLPGFIEQAPSQPGASNSPVLVSFSEHALAAGETVVLGYAYGPTPAPETESELRALDAPVDNLFKGSMQAWRKYVPSVDLGEPSLNRELAWSSYYVRSGSVYHRGFNAHTLPQGGAYQYLSGVNAGPRATLQQALPLIWLAPELAKDVLRFTLEQTHPSGEVPYAEVGSGLIEKAGFIPSDNDLWLLWAVSNYILARRDRQFLTEQCSYWPPPYTRPEPVWDHCVRAFRHLTEDIGYGPHGLLRMRTSDWNDDVISSGGVPMDRVWAEGESTLNSAMAVHVLRRFAELARYARQPAMEKRAREHADKLTETVRACWRERRLNRGWRDRNNEIGARDLYLEPQPWALIADILSPQQREILVEEIGQRLADSIGSRIFSSAGETISRRPGVVGQWASINSTLVWGLSKVSPERAWKELLQNTLFNHARVYPSIWFGIWSGPDSYLPSDSDRPGESWMIDNMLGLQSWPVQILFPHSEILNGSLWMLGIEGTADGISVRPRAPFPVWSWSGSGLSLSYETARIRGSVSGVGPELITVEIQLPPEWQGSRLDIEEGGEKRSIARAEASVRLNLWVAPSAATEFAVNRA